MCPHSLGVWFFNITEHASHSAVWPTQYLKCYPFTLFPQQFTVVHHSLHIPSASDRLCLFLWSSYLWTSCCLCCPDSSVAFLPPLLEKNVFFFLTEILASFLFKLAHSLLITIDYFWLWFILICEMYAPELNAVLHKSISLRKIIHTFVCSFS